MNLRQLRDYIMHYPTRNHYMPIWSLELCELRTGGGLPPVRNSQYTVPRVLVPNAVLTALFLRINEFYRLCVRTRSNGCLGFFEPPTSNLQFSFIYYPWYTQYNLIYSHSFNLVSSWLWDNRFRPIPLVNVNWYTTHFSYVYPTKRF